jgi:hypothetical protein
MVAISEELVANSDELLAITQAVRDPKTAKDAVPKLETAFPKWLASMKALFELGNKKAKEGVIGEEEGKQFVETMKSFQGVMLKIKLENKRLQTIHDLPIEFWNVARVNWISTLSIVSDVEPMKSKLPAEAIAFMKSLPAMMDEFGPERVVQIELPGTSNQRAREIADRLREKVGDSGKVSFLASEQEISVYVAPIGDFEKFVREIDFGSVVDQDEPQRRIVVQTQPEAPAVASDDVQRGNDDGRPPWWEVPKPERPPFGAGGVQPEVGPEPPAPGPDGFVRNERGAFRPFRGDDLDMHGPNFGDLPVPSDPDYHKKLCDLMQDPARADRAIDVLIRVRPEDIPDKDVRQKIARNFRVLALEGRRHNAEKVVQGLVLYGGKFSIPILIDLLEREQLRAPHAVFDGLAEFQDPKAAEAVGRQLGDFFNHDAAVAALRKMGPVAEDVLIKSAPSNDAKVSLAAVKLLGDVGTPRSLNVLGKALRSKNPLIEAAAKQAAKDVRDRSRKPVRQDGK